MSGIWAKSVLASRHSITGVELHTILARLPRQVLPEVNTHRVFSGNTASSRAIPFAKLVQQVIEDPFVPEVWTRNQKGMQGIVEDRAGEIAELRHMWLLGRDNAVKTAWRFEKRGSHKQIVNRLLEPWMWTIKLITATEWENFDALRDHPAAEPHMQLLAKAIKAARAEAFVRELHPGMWHLPFDDGAIDSVEDAKILSVARCASTSYKTVDGFDMTLEKAKEIYEKLKGPPMHASPYEHCAQADEWKEGYLGPYGEWRGGNGFYANPHQHRNFRGFRQLRAQIEA